MTATTRRGLLLAAVILLGWVGSLLMLLPTQPGDIPLASIVMAVLVRTLLQTGLFIVAHDAMHGTLWPEWPRANQRIGQLMLLLYAALPYGRCLSNHHRHHRHAGSALDPDHHREGRAGLLGWFQTFMAAYLSPCQITHLVLLWLAIGMMASGGVPRALPNVGLYCVLPTLLSSLQLFVVGTFIPHRSGAHRPDREKIHQPRSLDCPPWLSLLCCYHFGYHWEHHAFPHLPWYQLPKARRRMKERFKSSLPFAVL